MPRNEHTPARRHYKVHASIAAAQEVIAQVVLQPSFIGADDAKPCQVASAIVELDAERIAQAFLQDISIWSHIL